MRRRRERAFVSTACFLLAVLLLVLSLSMQIRLRAAENEIEAARGEIARMKKENGIMNARLAGRLSLEELERRAKEELGMSRCRADQTVEIVIEEDNPE